MGRLYILYELASGYSLFYVTEAEEAGMLLPQVEQAISNHAKFCTIVKFVAFSAYKNALNALENVNAISEGILHNDLELFLKTYLAFTEEGLLLGVAENKLAGVISETLGVSCLTTGAVPEIFRGLRYHGHTYIKGLTPQSSDTARLSLGHSYSRNKIKFNVHKVDNMIIQSISLIDQLDKDINTFTMRLREWYSYHFPELVKIVKDNYLFVKLIQVIGDRKSLNDDSLAPLTDVLDTGDISVDSGKAEEILLAAKSSMGMDISDLDLMNIRLFADRVLSLTQYRRELHDYLSSKMTSIAPNLTSLIGEQVGARLISHAGSLTNLAKYPASTVQILGAEKALFRALKTRGNTPKYGLIFHSSFIGRASAKNKGRISRYLSNKCSIASRVDCFSEIGSDVFGVRMKQQVEDRLKFYEVGDAHPTNAEAMKEAVEEFEAVLAEKRKQEQREREVDSGGTEKKKKKKKKRKLEEDGEETHETFDNTVGSVEESMETSQVESVGDSLETDGQVKKKKKKKKVKEELAEEMDVEEIAERFKPKKKKKHRLDDN